MKKILAIILSVALIMSALVFPTATFLASAQDTDDTALSFSDAITVLDGKINPRAIRTKVLSDGTVAAVYYRSGRGIYYAESKDGGVSFSDGVELIKNQTDSEVAALEDATTQTALAKEYVATYGQYGRGRLEAQNPNLIELADGNIAAFYRYNTFTSAPDTKPWSIYYSSICYQILDKKTGVWGDVQVMVETEKNKSITSPDSDYGYWEPDPVYITDEQGNTELFVYYADTSTPNNLSQQHIMYCVYDDDTNKFGTPAIAQNGTNHTSRDGMSVVTKLSDGTYAMVFESTKTNKNNTEDYITFVIKMSFSKDGRNWTDPVIVAKPDVEIRDVAFADTTQTEYAVCASPYVVTLPDGRLAISYQTTDRFTGKTPNRVSYRVGSQVALSSQVITYDTFADKSINDDVTAYFPYEINPGVLGENEFSKSAQLMVKDNKLYVYYGIGANIWDGGNFVKNDFGAVNMAYMDVSSEESFGCNLDDYLVYKANEAGADPTVAEDVISIPASGTSNLIVGSGSAYIDYDNPKETAVADLYLESNYTQYNTKNADRVTVSEEDSKITISGATKMMFNNTTDMGAFDASSILQVRASDGYMQSGYTFHAQKDYLTSAAYDTPGYMVILKRETKSLNKLDLVVRYVDTALKRQVAVAHELTTELSPSDFNCKFRFDLKVTTTQFIVNVYQVNDNGTEKKLGDTISYNLNYTATVASAPIYESGAFCLMTNGATTYSELEITRIDYPEVDTRVFEQAANLNAHGVFTLLDTPATMYAGFNFRVQDAAAVTRGINGYAVKLYQTADTIVDDTTVGNLKVELSIYGVNADGNSYQNLGNDARIIASQVLSDTTTSAGAKMIMDAQVVDNLLTVKVTNYNDPTKTAEITYDLNNYADKAMYECGGFGIFKHGTGAITVEDVKFTKVVKDINKIDDSSIYTVYRPEESEEVTFADGAIINNDATRKKIILNDTMVSDFSANATFEIGHTGNLNSGIIFRAQNIGGEKDAMEGYSVAVWKNENGTGNFGRIIILFYKWGRDANGNMKYLGEIARLDDRTTLNSVYPEAATSILGAVGVHIRVNLDVDGKVARANFDVLDEYNEVAASSEYKYADLTKNFSSEAINTAYNYGAVGLSVSEVSSVCDFNITEQETGIEVSDISGYTVYSNNDDTMTLDNSTNRKMYSITEGRKQAVLKGITLTDFVAKGTLKSNTAGKVYNMGFDFMINEETHSGYAHNTNHATMGYEGYRIVLVRNVNTHANPAGAVLYLFKFTKGDSGYTRTTVKQVSGADFFADYTSYAEVEVDLEVKLIGGTLTATATMCEYPDKVITLTEDGISGSGAVGWWISDHGSVSNISVNSYDLADTVITAADCENGSVYAAVNSGAAAVGDTVKIVPVAADGYSVSKVYATVGGEKTEIAKGEDGYEFTKQYGATEISAEFVLKNDLDGDGNVDANDLVVIRRILLGTADTVGAADLDGDGNITLIDFVKFKKLVAAAAK